MKNNSKPISKLIRPNGERATSIILVFSIMIISDLILGVTCLLFYDEFDGATFTRIHEIKDSGYLILIMIFSIINVVLLIIAIINFLNWFRRAYFNLHLFSDKKPHHDEDMAVWSFMIPIINLFRPLSIAFEIYDGTHKKAEQLSKSTIVTKDLVILIWWFAFVGLGIINALINNIGGEDTIHEIIQSTFYLGISELLEVLRLIAAIYMIKVVSNVESIVYKNRLGFDEEVEAKPIPSFEEE